MKTSKIKEEIMLWMEVLPKALRLTIRTFLFILLLVILFWTTMPVFTYLVRGLEGSSLDGAVIIYLIFLVALNSILFTFFKKLFIRKNDT